MIPALIGLIVITALARKVPVYSSFTEGAADGLKVIIGIFPAMLAVITASYMMRASGVFDMLCSVLAPLLCRLGIPAEVVPLMLLRPVSGGGSLGLLTDMLNTYGADSEIGRIASVITGSTETTFYCICVYFANTRVKNSAKVIPCAVIGDIVGMLTGIAAVRWF